MQAAKMPGLAKMSYGEQTKGQKTYGKIVPLPRNNLHT